MLNRITITGRLTYDPELRKTPNDISVTNFSIANQRDYKNSDGERETDFFDVIAWRANAEFVTQYFRKGSLITVDGRLETRRYVDKNGNNRVVVEIKADNTYFGESKNDGSKAFAQTGGTDFVPDFSAASGEGDDEFPFDAFPSFQG